MRKFTFILLGISCLALTCSFAQDAYQRKLDDDFRKLFPNQPVPNISAPSSPSLSALSQFMRPEEIKDFGLNKLSSEEQERLGAWLIRYARAASRIATESPGVSGSGGTVESRIDGEFEGWTGETIFKLINGQIWQQAGSAYTYHYAFRPNVLIYQDGTIFRMKVDGVSESLPVKQIK